MIQRLSDMVTLLYFGATGFIHTSGEIISKKVMKREACLSEFVYERSLKYRVGKLNVTRKFEKLPYSLSLPEQPIYPFQVTLNFLTLYIFY